MEPETMNASARQRSLRILLALGVTGLCSACNTMQTLIPGAYSSRTQAGVESHSGTTTQADKVVTLPLSAADIECPIVEIEDGAASMRVGGPANSDVRYQFDIAETARECQPQGSNFALKIGISGHLLIGPAGTPGSDSATIKVLVRREEDQKTAYEKSYKIEANTNGAAQAPFQLVTEPILLPLTRKQLNDDYSIFVGFDNGKNTQIERPRGHRKPVQTSAN
jgi:hypothetical protein